MEAVPWIMPNQDVGNPNSRPSHCNVFSSSSVRAGDEVHSRPMLFNAAISVSANTPGNDPPAEK